MIERRHGRPWRLGFVLGCRLVLAVAHGASLTGERVVEGQRMIPVADRVDVVVVGGTTWGVSAAMSAAKAKARVLLVTDRHYLGEDLAGTLRLRLDDGEEAQTPLGQAFYGEGRETTPMRVKQLLDEALAGVGARFLFGCYATDVLRQADGTPAGIVMANRSGRQAVVAKVIVDATDRAWVARLAGARSAPWPETPPPATWVVMQPAKSGGIATIRHEFPLHLPNGTFAALSAAGQEARDRGYSGAQLRASDRPFFVPPDPVIARRRAAAWRDGDTEDINLDHFRPAGLEHVYVLSGAADVPREEAARLLRPTGLMPLAERLGRMAAADAAKLPDPDRPQLPARGAGDATGRTTRELLDGLRPTGPADKDRVPAAGRELPVWGHWDVVVVGGGTSGGAAAIAAARRGASVLVAEYHFALGGTGTLGLIGKPYHGARLGFAKEVPFPDKRHNLEYKMEWYRRQIREAGGTIWFGALACGAVVTDQRVTGVVLATPEGRGAVLAKVVIDGTGNADVAVAAGAKYLYGATEDGYIAMQGAGIPVRPLGRDYVNSDYLFIDETDMVDVARALVGTRETMSPKQFDSGSFIQTRERRRIVGDYVLTYLDEMIGRTYPDSVVRSASDYDSHGYPNSSFFALLPHDAKSRKANHPAPGGWCYTPYRCLCPKGLTGILVTGLGISMRRDAAAMVRMQHDLSNQGYAAGLAAATAAAAGKTPRQVDIRALQRELIAVGNLPSEVLEQTDSYPLPDAEVAAAVKAFGAAGNPQQAGRPLAVILAHADTAQSMLRDARVAAEGAPRLAYARVLGVLGDREVVPELHAALAAVTAWDAKIFQGRMAEYAHLPTPVDGLILALGYTGDKRAVPAILRLAEWLDADVTLSHHRAVALALERLGDHAAAPVLARVLAKPGMRGHVMREAGPLYDQQVGRRRRTGALREIILARALFHCGDQDGLGRQILEAYRSDLRGLFSRHADAVLSARP